MSADGSLQSVNTSDPVTVNAKNRVLGHSFLTTKQLANSAA